MMNWIKSARTKADSDLLPISSTSYPSDAKPLLQARACIRKRIVQPTMQLDKLEDRANYNIRYNIFCL